MIQATDLCKFKAGRNDGSVTPSLSKRIPTDIASELRPFLDTWERRWKYFPRKSQSSQFEFLLLMKEKYLEAKTCFQEYNSPRLCFLSSNFSGKLNLKWKFSIRKVSLRLSISLCCWNLIKALNRTCWFLIILNETSKCKSTCFASRLCFAFPSSHFFSFSITKRKRKAKTSWKFFCCLC